MKIKDGFTLRTICGEHIVIGEGLAQVNFNKMLSLNGSAAYLWEQLKGKEFTEEDAVKLLTDKYDVTPERALEDVKKLLEEWKKQVAIVEAEELKRLEASSKPSAKEYDLERFLTAQAADYADALDDICHGRKRGHWIWYIFPQQKGLGHSYNSEYYGLDGIDEARAYLAHPILGARLREISEALLTHEGKRDIDAIMGSSIDVLKLQTCMNLFNRVSPNDIFEKVLDAFF